MSKNYESTRTQNLLAAALLARCLNDDSRPDRAENEDHDGTLDIGAL